MKSSCLSSILIVEDNQGRREIVLDDSLYSLGRDTKCDVRLTSQFVSRHHATLVQLPKEDGSLFYRILDGNLQGRASANGMLVNGRKLESHDLQNEDEIIFGPQARAVYYQRQKDTTSSVSSDSVASDGSTKSNWLRNPYPLLPELEADAGLGDVIRCIP
ncbi:FHA domain-containing protein [Leptothoe sp. ISB3NOV94-8A]|uniref:FHA domain-containing protein n=1 Tax=Adonisia turfae CCMR0081 TaxID=2292702 RepID=A0A6M0RM31_9CYAN|nr:FHA domain-containing protein [Adonisia turfae]MDV3352140.1 FHA domain-containing protein [Leptothoe sp. LEGE 181152]NEZ56920.1 FHA domain-containing protein [Adonisia turfae CCMR0081]